MDVTHPALLVNHELGRHAPELQQLHLLAKQLGDDVLGITYPEVTEMQVRAIFEAAAELLARPGTPARVVLDEAVEIARRYGSAESGGFVNGVLDRVARRLRPGEL